MAEIDGSTGWRLARAISRIAGSKASGSESGTATYAGTDASGVSWVRLPGADADTPVNGSTVADARPGDSVSYAIEDGRLSITGNASDPAVGATRMGAAVSVVQAALDSARSTLSAAISTAQSVADAAKGVAEATSQHFWTDSSGVHVTQATQDEWDTDNEGANVLLNSTGQLFRDGLNNLLTLTTTAGARALTIWDGAGNAASNVLATIGSTITLGRSTATHISIDSDSMEMYDGSTPIGYFTSSDSSGDDSGYTVDRSAEFGVGDGTGKLAASHLTSSSSSGWDDGEVLLTATSGGEDGAYAALSLTARTKNNGSAKVSYLYAQVDEVQFSTDVTSNLPLSSAFKAYNAGSPPKYIRRGNTVNVTGEVMATSNIAADGYATIGTLPLGCRPTSDQRLICQGSGTAIWLLTIYTNGSISISRYRRGTTSAAIDTNTWLPFSATFVTA